MVKEAMCSDKLCMCLADAGMDIGFRKGFFGKVHYECSLAQAMRWFRDSKGIYIQIVWYDDNTWDFNIVSDYPTGEKWSYAYYSYEDAAEAGLYMALEHLENL